MSTAISVENLSKKYIIKQQSGHGDSLAAKIKGSLKKQASEFWALKDIDLTISHGDILGIIGRNGAGKSTLLKILSRIVSPSTGRVEINGRIASLLEVGTGFHPELTGRENIFLNGSILGMAKSEIKNKFDEIVAFSEVEKFIDTPVKRYSSGMYVRLAFAVAAHLDPEILIVDEVLAVGDASFQKKCLGKMQEVSRDSGKTILFVSHNMAAIQKLCNRFLYLKDGKMVSYGNSQQVITEYLTNTDVLSVPLHERSDRSGNGLIKFEEFYIENSAGKKLSVAQCGSELNLCFKVRSSKNKLNDVHFSAGLDDEYGIRVAHFSNELTDQLFQEVSEGSSIVKINIKNFPFKAGNYKVTLYSSVKGEVSDWIQEAADLEVETGDFFNTGKLPPQGQSTIFINHSFSITNV